MEQRVKTPKVTLCASQSAEVQIEELVAESQRVLWNWSLNHLLQKELVWSETLQTFYKNFKA